MINTYIKQVVKIFNKIANNISNYNRKRKFNFFLESPNPTKEIKILDVGASEKEYQDNSNIIEKRYSYPENITVLGIDHFNEFKKKYPKVKIIRYSGEIFPFKENAFDICWCNAVIEHVGDRNKQTHFLREIARVAKTAYLTTPNRYFPFEVHTRIVFLHYLPKKYFDKILVKLNKTWATGDYMHLLSLKELKKLLSKCNIKNYKIKKNKVFCFTLDFVIIF